MPNDDGLFVEPLAKKQRTNLDQSFQKKKCLSRVQSLASLLSPAGHVKKAKSVLRQSLSGIRMSPMSQKFTSPIQTPSSTRLKSYTSMIDLSNNSAKKNTKRNHVADYSIVKQTKKHSSCLWIETLPSVTAKAIREKLTRQQLCRQEAIYELFQGEQVIVDDLLLVQQTYHDSLLHLGILQPEELKQIFGSFHELIPLHEALIKKIKALQQENDIFQCIGQVLLNWVPELNVYKLYCSNLIKAKDLLDERKLQDKKFEDFLQRCLESPFSRKLDLWNFLDVPRNRLVKYPLLFKQILKQTSKDSPDALILPKVIHEVEQIIKTVDESTGQANCKFILEKLDFPYPHEKNCFLEESTSLLCSGILRNNRGTKLNAFLFNNGLVLSRRATRYTNYPYKTVYQVYRDPIPSQQLVVTDMKDGKIRMGGSFRNAFSSNVSTGAKNIFSVSFCDESSGYSHVLQTDNEHDKKQWLKSLASVAVKVIQTENTDDDDGGFLQHQVLKSRNRLSCQLDESLETTFAKVAAKRSSTTHLSLIK